MSSGIPLVGMGAGTFELRADGRMYEWQIFNNWASTLTLPDTFFGIHTSGGGHAPVARRLETVTDTLLPGTPVEQITYEGKFPTVLFTFQVTNRTGRLTAAGVRACQPPKQCRPPRPRYAERAATHGGDGGHSDGADRPRHPPPPSAAPCVSWC